MNKIICRFISLATLFFLSAPVLAGGVVAGSITFAADATPVPTLSGVMLMIMALLLAVVGYRVLKQKDNNASRMMVLSLIGVGALVSGAGGIKLINDAYAGFGHEVPAPGQYDIYGGGSVNTYNNTSSATLTVTAIGFQQGYLCNGSCAVDATIADGSSCDLTCIAP